APKAPVRVKSHHGGGWLGPLTLIVCLHTIPASTRPNAEGMDVRKIDAFAHILPPGYARRLESIMSGPVSDRILGYQPWIHEDPALTGLDARWRGMDRFGDYRQGLTPAVPPPGELRGPAAPPGPARPPHRQPAPLGRR